MRQRMPQKSSINFMMVVDGERRITVHKPLPPQCEVVSDERYLDILDKGEGKGAVLIQERVVPRGAQRRQAVHHRLVHFRARRWRLWRQAAGRAGAARNPRARARPGEGMRDPARPGVSVCLVGRPQSAAPRSRLSPGWSAFPRPILHGLCSYGTACRAVLSTLAQIPARTHHGSSMCASPSRCFPARPWWWRCGRTAARFPIAPR